MPTDPRVADGACNVPGFDQAHQPYMTGGVGAGDVPASVTGLYPWPPASITNSPGLPALAVTELPAYTPTGSPLTLPPPSFEAASTTINAGNGIFNPQVTLAAYVEVGNCQYPDRYLGDGAAIPVPACGAAAAAALRRDVAEPLITPAP